MKTLPIPIRLVIADDAICFREGFKLMMKLHAKDMIEIVGEAENGKKLIALVEAIKPDVVITDIRMPVMDGYQATTILHNNHTSPPILAISNWCDDNTVFQIMKAGAKGYLQKNSDLNEMIDAIQTVHNGRMYYSTSTSKSLIRLISNSRLTDKNKNDITHFSNKELQFIHLLCKELTAKEMAKEMQLSCRSVDDYCRKIKGKTNTKSLVGIALYAIKHKLIHEDDIQF